MLTWIGSWHIIHLVRQRRRRSSCYLLNTYAEVAELQRVNSKPVQRKKIDEAALLFKELMRFLLKKELEDLEEQISSDGTRRGTFAA